MTILGHRTKALVFSEDRSNSKVEPEMWRRKLPFVNTVHGQIKNASGTITQIINRQSLVRKYGYSMFCEESHEFLFSFYCCERGLCKQSVPEQAEIVNSDISPADDLNRTPFRIFWMNGNLNNCWFFYLFKRAIINHGTKNFEFRTLNLRNRKTDPILFIIAHISVSNVTLLFKKQPLRKLVARTKTLINYPIAPLEETFHTSWNQGCFAWGNLGFFDDYLDCLRQNEPIISKEYEQ